MSRAASGPSRRRFSVAQLILVIPWVAIVIDAWAPVRDNSFLWHIRAGVLQSAAGGVLTEDPFSFTMLGEPWLTQSWLAELLYAWGEVVSGGLGFVPAMMLLANVVTFSAIGLVAYRRGRSVMSAAIVLLLSVLALITFMAPRPVVLSFALFALTILAWEIPRIRWTVPFIIWIWASVHGSFAIGLVYVGLTLLARKEWRWLPTAFVAGLLTLATAHGLGVIQMLLDFTQAGDALALMGEWRRPGLGSPVFIPFLGGLLIVVIGLVSGRLPLRRLWVVIPFAILGFTSLRAVPPAWLALVPSVASSLGDLKAGTKPRFSTGAAAVYAGLVVVLPFVVMEDGGLSEERFPVAAAAHLENIPTFHDDRTGGYLIYELGPEFLVYIDDRAELYQERLVEFVAVRDGDASWQAHFAREGIEQALLSRDSELVSQIAAAGWEKVYEDEEFVVLRS
jgi:hypothetical protein